MAHLPTGSSHARAHRFLALIICIWIAGRIGYANLPRPQSHSTASYQIANQTARETQATLQRRSHVETNASVDSSTKDNFGARQLKAAASTYHTPAIWVPMEQQAFPVTTDNGGIAKSRARGAELTGPSKDRIPSLVPEAISPLGSDIPVSPSQALPRRRIFEPERWSLGVATYWRAGSGASSSVGPGGVARLGGTQSAARLTYVVEPQRQLRAYARLTHTPVRRDGMDIAVGVALRPIRSLPVDVHVERRTVVAGDGRDTTLVYAAGGIDNRRLAQNFRLSAYGQAGVADFGELVGFADAAVVVQREVAEFSGMRLSLGSVAAAAVQPDARRVDVGPRAAIFLPKVGQGALVAFDWRERVAGNARPGSGLAVTLAADF